MSFQKERPMFSSNGLGVEKVNIGSLVAYDAWKNGTVMYLETEDCFAGFELTEKREMYIISLYEKHKMVEDLNAFINMTEQEKQEFYINFIKRNYGAITYEDFKKRYDKFIEKRITFDDGKEAVVFYGISEKWKGNLKEV